MTPYLRERWTFTAHIHISKYAHNTTQGHKIQTETYTGITVQDAHAVHGSNTTITRLEPQQDAHRTWIHMLDMFHTPK